METAIITPDNVIELVLLDARVERMPELSRLAVEARIMAMTKQDARSRARLAEEAYGCLTMPVLQRIKELTGVAMIRQERASGRVMDTCSHLSDKTGIASVVSRGLGGYACLAPYRGETRLSITWFN